MKIEDARRKIKDLESKIKRLEVKIELLEENESRTEREEKSLNVLRIDWTELRQKESDLMKLLIALMNEKSNTQLAGDY